MADCTANQLTEQICMMHSYVILTVLWASQAVHDLSWHGTIICLADCALPVPAMVLRVRFTLEHAHIKAPYLLCTGRGLASSIRTMP